MRGTTTYYQCDLSTCKTGQNGSQCDKGNTLTGQTKLLLVTSLVFLVQIFDPLAVLCVLFETCA